MERIGLNVCVRVTSETNMEAVWYDKTGYFHVRLHGMDGDVVLFIGEEDMDRLCDIMRVAQVEHHIRSGKVQVPDDDGPVLGGRPGDTACRHGTAPALCPHCSDVA